MNSIKTHSLVSPPTMPAALWLFGRRKEKNEKKEKTPFR
jgi:hypothetical protein